MSGRTAFMWLRPLMHEHHLSHVLVGNVWSSRLTQRLFLCGKFSVLWQSKQSISNIAPKNVLELHQRGIFKDIYPQAAVGLPDTLSKKQCFYCGFDPTADSLHIGNLLSIMALLHCQRLGHEAIAVVGTATARAGDPSEHSKDRKTLEHEKIHSNAEKICQQIQHIVDNHADNIYDCRGKKRLPDFHILPNHLWFEEVSAIDFISHVCRRFRIGPMMDKKYIKDRMEGNEGLILAEFMYQTLQSYDWLYLFENYNCSFQIGGMDQLGNIDAGHQLIKKVHRGEVYGLLTPLLTTMKGDKLGKTAGNTVYLNPHRTSPFEFYQFFFRQPDSMVEMYLKCLTFLDLKTIRDIMQKHKEQPQKRNAQRILATQVCKIVHGKEGLESAERCTQALYSGRIEDLEKLSDDEINATFDATNIVNCSWEPHTTLFDACQAAKAIPNGEHGERLIETGGVRVNGRVITSPQQLLLPDTHILRNDLTLLTVGKIKHYVLRWKLPPIDSLEGDGDKKARVPPEFQRPTEI